jgi:hypothetical protein
LPQCPVVETQISRFRIDQQVTQARHLFGGEAAVRIEFHDKPFRLCEGLDPEHFEGFQIRRRVDLRYQRSKCLQVE